MNTTNKPATTAADPVAVANLCEKHGRPAMIERLLKERLAVEQVEQRLTNAVDIIALGESAARRHPRIKREAAAVCEVLADEGASLESTRRVLDCMTAAVEQYETKENDAHARGEIQEH
jgi:hypothetical protein